MDIRKEEIKNQLSNFYYEPNLNELSITLKLWNIKNMIVEIPIEILNEAPIPILSLNDKEEYFFISKISNDDYECFFCNESKYRSLTKDELSEIWSGVCILIESCTESGEINAETKNKKYTTLKFTEKLIFGSLLLCISLGFVSFKGNIFLYLTSVLGFGLSLYSLMREKSFFNSQLIDICKIGKRFDCEKVITSEKSKIFGFSLSEISIGFFIFLIINFIIYDIDSLPSSYIIPIIYLSSISILFSIIQQIRMKVYCLICLAISLTLFILIAIVYFNYGLLYTYINFYDLLFPLAITFLIIGLIKNYLFLNEEFKKLKYEVNSFTNSSLISYGFIDNRIVNKVYGRMS